MADLSPALAEELRIEGPERGVVVMEAPRGTTAGRLGFRRGDVVLKVNGREPHSVAGLERLLHASGDRWRIALLRDGKTLSFVFRGLTGERPERTRARAVRGRRAPSAGRPAAPGPAAGRAGPGPFARTGRADRPHGGRGQADLDGAVGSARQRQDHHRAAAGVRDGASFRAFVGRLLGGRGPQAGVRGGARTPPRRAGDHSLRRRDSTASTAPSRTASCPSSRTAR